MPLNPENEETPVAIWKVMKPGTHAAIVTALEANAAIKTALDGFKAKPNPTTRDAAVDIIVRFTGNCIGQAALAEQKGQNPPAIVFAPDDSSKSIYKVLEHGESPIFTAIDADSQTRDALHKGNDDVTISLISRMTGRCVGQTLFGAGIGFFAAAGKLSLL